MRCAKTKRCVLAAVLVLSARIALAGLDPTGLYHLPIGIPNTLDPLKTIVEAEGNFSPGFATFGVYFWVYDKGASKLLSPTEITCTHGLNGTGYLIPWASWKSGSIEVRTEVCEVETTLSGALSYVTGARALVKNSGSTQIQTSVFAALRPIGAAGWQVKSLAVSPNGNALLVDGHTAMVAPVKPSAAGVSATDNVGTLAATNAVPTQQTASSASGTCSGALRFDLTLAAGETKEVALVCPVLAGTQAWRHVWIPGDFASDNATIHPTSGGVAQPDAGADVYAQMNVGTLFQQATAYWRNFVGKVTINVPDKAWVESFAAIVGHVAVAMNEYEPDVSVINYNTYNRDGMYVTNMLQKSGNFDLSGKIITEYFFKHPFSGRGFPEADNPGQILWVTGQQWLYTRDAQWLQTVYPSVQKIAALIQYCRTTPTPHYVNMNGLEFGTAVPAASRSILEPGRCDGYNFNYTEAYDLAGMRAAVTMAKVMNNTDDASAWQTLANTLTQDYDTKYGANLGNGYGSFCVQWPCRLYPLDQGKAYDQFKTIGAVMLYDWRYFGPARSHQGLLAGNRESGYQTANANLNHDQMKNWYAYDEGPYSGIGLWSQVSNWTKWKSDRAMPHGWAVAEVFLLLRDCLVFEDTARVVLFGGIPPAWFNGSSTVASDVVEMKNFPTWFGTLNCSYTPLNKRAVLRLSGTCSPPQGFVLRLPATGFTAQVSVGGTQIPRTGANDFVLPAGTTEATITASTIVGPDNPPVNAAARLDNRTIRALDVYCGNGLLRIRAPGLGACRIDVIDGAGRVVATRAAEPGALAVFETREMPAGIHWVRLSAGARTAIAKVLIR